MTTPKLISFPMRPTNGGTRCPGLLRGQWDFEPKYNGWRALIHVPTRMVFNRHGATLSIGKAFHEAMDELCSTLDKVPEAFEWIDCEGLERRHNIGHGTLIVLDVIPEPEFSEATYAERRLWFTPGLIRRHHPGQKPDANSVYASSTIAAMYAPQAWDQLQAINKEWGCQFYEGLVAKRHDAPYNIQTVSPEQTSSAWCKFRWSW